MKVEAKGAVRACSVALVAGIMAAASLSGCAVALLGGAARSGGSASASSGGGTSGGTAGPTAADSSIAAAVRSRFSASSTLKPLKIVVDTHDGIVTLRGQVNSVEQRNAAQAEARVVNGVRGVNNQLTVR